MHALIPAVERLLLTTWAGALWAIGYLAVPVLFSSLDDRVLAGALAGRMFHLVSAIGLAAGGGLLLIGVSVRPFRPRWQTVLLVLMLVGVAVGEFWLQPQMAALKAAGLAEGSAQAMAFGRLHGVAAVIYLGVSLGAAALVVGRDRIDPRMHANERE